MARFASRKDANHSAIVEAFQKVGCSVYVMDHPADLLVGLAGVTLLVEIKQTRRRGWASEKTERQKRFIAKWSGQYDIVYTVDDALELVAFHRANPRAEYKSAGNLVCS